MIEDDILTKARKILIDRETNSERIETCLKAGLCPNCGEPADPQRRNDGELFRFTCKQCMARYLRPRDWGSDWKEIIPYSKKV